jgi:hypothetical protein
MSLLLNTMGKTLHEIQGTKLNPREGQRLEMAK